MHNDPNYELLIQIATAVRELHATVDDLRKRLEGTSKPQYTVDEVGRLTGRSAYTIRRWVKAGQLEAIRISGTGPRGRLLIPRQELIKLIAMGRGTRIPEEVDLHRQTL